jgi:hypothetical protein
MLTKLRDIPTNFFSSQIDEIFKLQTVRTFGNEELPYGSHYFGKSEKCSLSNMEILGVKKLLGIDFDLNDYQCTRYSKFSFGDAVFCSDRKSQSGKFVGNISPM